MKSNGPLDALFDDLARFFIVGGLAVGIVVGGAAVIAVATAVAFFLF